MHPRINGQTFSIFEPDGNNACFVCCGNKKGISKLAQEIGVGSTMFLMSSKAMSLLFFIFMILHLPVYVFYY